MCEAQAAHLRDALADARNGAHLTRQTDLAKDRELTRKRLILRRRGKRHDARQVGGGLGDFRATHRGDVAVELAHVQPGAALQYRQEHLDTRRIQTGNGAARGGCHRLIQQSLHLREQGAAALHRDGHAGASHRVRGARNKHTGGVQHGCDAVLVHVKAAHLVGGSEAVLNRAQHADIRVLIALELADHIHQVLEQARARDGAFLGHVAHEQGAHVAFLRGCNHGGGDLSHLGHAAGATLNFRGGEGLHRVDNQQGGVDLLDMRQGGAEVGFAGQVEGVRDGADAVGAELDLRGGFLAGNVQDRARRLGCDILHPLLSRTPGGAAREGGGDIQQQGGFTHAGFARHEDDRAGYESAAEHAIKFGVSGAHVGGYARVDLCDRLGGFLHAGCGAGARTGAPGGFFDGAPGLAFAAAAYPFGSGPAAFGAAVGGCGFGVFRARGHGSILGSGAIWCAVFGHGEMGYCRTHFYS